MNDCQQCEHYSGRLAVEGKLKWGKFCTLPGYRDQQPPAEIVEGYTCPLAEKDKNNGQTISKTAT